MESVDRLIAEIKHDSEYGRMANEAVKKLLAIATEIGCEHTTALGVEADGIWADVAKHYVELPHDSEGLPIRLGDMVEDPDGDVWRVDSMTIADDGWTVNNDTFSHFPDDGPLRHAQPDTWERIIKDAIIGDGGSYGCLEERFNATVPALVARCVALAGDAK